MCIYKVLTVHLNCKIMSCRTLSSVILAPNDIFYEIVRDSVFSKQLSLFIIGKQFWIISSMQWCAMLEVINE